MEAQFWVTVFNESIETEHSVGNLMDIFFLLYHLQNLSVFNIFRPAPVFWNALHLFIISLSEATILSLYLFSPPQSLGFSKTVLYFLCLCVSFGLSAPLSVVFSHYFIILLCHWHLPLWPLLHKHFTSPPLFLFPFSSSVFPSLPSSVCLSLCSRSEGPQTHLCALICCAIVPLTPCCQPLGPLSHWHPFIIILSSPSANHTHTHW